MLPNTNDSGYDNQKIQGKVDGCIVTVTPTNTDYVQISTEHDGQTVETTAIPKNRWIGHSGLKEYATEISNQLGVEYDTIHDSLTEARYQALLAWNWKTFIHQGAATAPGFQHLSDLTIPSPQVPNYPSTQDVRDKLGGRIENAMMEGRQIVFDSPTGSGKSYKSSTTSWLNKPEVTGGQQVIHLSPTQNAREDAVEDSQEAGLKHKEMLGRIQACPVARGDHDEDITVDGQPASEWISWMCNMKGISLHDAKARLLEVNDQGHDKLHCEEDGEKCKSKKQWNDIRDSIDSDEETEYDIIHGTHKFAFVPTLMYENNVIFDEQPSWAKIGPGDTTGGRSSEEDLDHDRIIAAVNAFLNDAGVDLTAGNLMTIAKREAADMGYQELRQAFPEIYEAFDHFPSREWFLNHDDAHTMARGFTKALWDAARRSEDANGRRQAKVSQKPPNLSTHPPGDEIIPDSQRIHVVINPEEMITTLRIKPHLGGTRSLIGLDAHPVEELWQLNTGDVMTIESFISDKERQLWRRYERRLCVIQMGSGAYSYTSEDQYDDARNRVLIKRLREQYGEPFRTAIAPSTVEDNVEEVFKDAGVVDPDTMHHGDIESRNDFKDEHIGAVIGCIDPGDDYVLDCLAELELEAEPERQDTDCKTCSGGGCKECNQTGKERDFGRGFTGEDSESAKEILASVRDYQVAQAVGRYAREPDNSDDWAAVFVRTTAIPDNMVDFEGPWVWKYEDKQKAIADYFRENTTGTAKAISDWIDAEHDTVESCSKRHVHETIDRHVEYQNVEKHEGAGSNGATIYEWTATDSVSEYGELKFEISEVDHSEPHTTAPVPEMNVCASQLN